MALVAMLSGSNRAQSPGTLTSKEQVQIVLQETKPLSHSLGDRLPLYVWAATNLNGTDKQIEETLRALAKRGIGAYSNWRGGSALGTSLDESVRVGQIQHRLGLRVTVNATDAIDGIFDGSPETAHIDDAGRTFFDESSSPKRKLGCPFGIQERIRAVRSRMEAICNRYRSASVPIDISFADWEIDGPIEWNDGWQAAQRCSRCRRHIPEITNFPAFQNAYRTVRSRIQKECYANVVLKHFPTALVGNYGVYPGDAWRYWFDYYEREPAAAVPTLTEHGARYRPWPDEFTPAGYTLAMPVVYTWYRTWNWYPWSNSDYHWFYNLLLVASKSAERKMAAKPFVSFVHYSTTSPPTNPDPEVKPFSESSYRELLWHMLLRGHDSFFLWCLQKEIVTEIRPLHQVWAAALAYKEFLDHGKPITFEVPDRPGPVISGLQLKDRILVRRTDFDPSMTGSIRVLVNGIPVEVPRLDGQCQIIRLAGAKH